MVLGAFAATLLTIAVGFFWDLIGGMYDAAPTTDPAVRVGQMNSIAMTRTALLAGVAGLGAIGTLVVNASTYRITARGHVTDRYAAAIELLGSPRQEVRLGGVYSLEQIAVDSSRSGDQRTVVEVLCAFVRMPRGTEREETAADAGPWAKLLAPLARAAEEQPASKVAQPAAADVLAAVTVLGRLPVRAGVPRADLRGAYVVEADLADSNLSDARLDGADLRRAYMPGATLRGVDITGATLEAAVLSNATVIDAKADETVMASCQMVAAVLTGLSARDCDLRFANLSGADLTRAYLCGALLDNANLTAVKLVDADLSGAGLSGTTLRDADLRGADLSRADLSGARLSGASLSGADLTDADLTGVDLSEIDTASCKGL